MSHDYRSRDPAPKGTPVEATYTYRDEQGALLFKVEKRVWHEGGKRKKTFTARAFLWYKMPGGVEPVWDVKMGDARRVLYRLPELRAAIAAGVEPIYFVEGEKDVEALAALGHVATTAPFGAGKWVPEYAAFLYGAKRVVVVSDVDGPENGYAGQRHAEAVAASLGRAGIPVKIMQPAAGKDVSEMLAPKAAA
jgi:putative DNA primase/helicase